MKKAILLMLMAVLASVGFTSLATVNVTVDNADNVTMTSSPYASPTVIPLQNGANPVDFNTLDPTQPLLFEGANGAEIISLTQNGAPQQPAMGTLDNKGYRIYPWSDNDEIVITTSGAAKAEATVTFSTSAPNTVKVLYGNNNEDIVYNPTSLTVVAGTVLRIEPMPGYKLNLSCLFGHVAENGDGTYNFIANSDDTIYSTATITGIQTQLNLDCAANAEISFGMGDDQYTLAMLVNGVNTIATDEQHLPLNIRSTEGAAIKSVTTDGKPATQSGDGCYHIDITNIAAVDVTTQGKEQEVKFCNFGTIGFEGFDITIAGEKIEASGKTDVKVTAHIGDQIRIAALPGTEIDYVSPGSLQSDGSYTLTLSEHNATIYVSGKKATGVTINIDDASRVQVIPLAGYGEPLSLVNGDNKFALSDLTAPVNFRATEGNQIVSVIYNGTAVEAQLDGTYNVTPVEGSFISVTSKVKPTSVPVTLALGKNWEKLSATIDGEPLELTGETFSLQIIPGAVISLSPAKGYEIVSVLAPDNEVSNDDMMYNIIISNPGTVSVVCEKMKAREGYAIVTIDSNISLWYSELDEEGLELQKLGTDKAYEVKIGSTVEIYTFTTSIHFDSVTVNGTPVEADPDSPRHYYITITGDADIVVEAYKKVQISTERVVNPDNGSIIGNLYIKDGENKTTSCYASPGDVIEFISEPGYGYKLDCIKCIYPEKSEEYTTSYTVTEDDLNYEVIVFRGTYSKADEEKTLYYVEGNTTQTTIDGVYVNMGEVWPLDANGNKALIVTAYENESVDFVITTEPGFTFTNLSLFYESDRVLENPYVVNPADANSQDIISIVGIFAFEDKSVEMTDANDSNLRYHKAAKELVSEQPITVYTISGLIVEQSEEGKINLEGYAPGIYIAVSGNCMIKFTL